MKKIIEKYIYMILLAILYGFIIRYMGYNIAIITSLAMIQGDLYFKE